MGRVIGWMGVSLHTPENFILIVEIISQFFFSLLKYGNRTAILNEYLWSNIILMEEMLSKI